MCRAVCAHCGVLLFSWLAAVTALAQPDQLLPPVRKDDALATSLGVTSKVGSLPPWSKPSQEAKQELGEFIRSAQKAAMLVGDPKHGRGTAWVISKKHRLLVTNAHVADIMHEAGGSMMAIVNGTADVYKVERAWYHPGVRRQISGAAVVKSAKPSDGPVHPNCPDVALLQLADGGPDLAVELQMAGPETFEHLFAQPAAILGYPGHDTQSWPQIGETAEATFHDGVISRLSNFRNNVSVPLPYKQFVQYTMSTWGGFSGSPVFLTDGRVVAIHNSAKYESGAGGDVKAIPHGVRIDCLWELVVHHGLQDKIPLPVEDSQVDVQRWLEDDPEDLEVRKAVELVREASDLIYNQEKFSEGAAKCAEAIKIAPGYAEAYNVRCDAYLNYFFAYRRQVDEDTAFKQLQYAERDALKYAALCPAEPWAFLNLVSVYNNAGQFLDDDDHNRKALQIVTKLLESENLPKNARAHAHSSRGVAFDNLDEDDAALAEHNAAVREDPSDPTLFENRADFWHYQDREDLEEEDKATARKIREERARRRQQSSP